MSNEYIKNVAIVGAGGTLGSFITSSLVASNRFNVTAITRNGSSTALPSGLHGVKKVDYDDHSTLLDALRGKDALVITLSGKAGNAIEERLVRAAGEAGVKWILPNEWSPDTAEDVDLVRDMPQFASKVKTRNLIAELGQSSYMAMVTGFWYEFAISNPSMYGFDVQKKKFIRYDAGEQKISTTTWPQIGNAVASLLSLPISTLQESFANKLGYISSFTLSQNDIFASILRVTNTTEADWTIESMSARERFQEGVKVVKEGNMAGFSKYTSRVFFDDGIGDFEGRKGVSNEVLGLEKEDLDEATRRGVEMQMKGGGH